MTSIVTTPTPADPLEHSNGSARRWAGSGETDAETLVQTATLGICIACLVVGIMGLILPYPREHVPAEPPPPVVAQMIHVDLPAPAPMARAAAAAPAQPDKAEPPPPTELPTPPQAPPVAVALPSPTIFAKPVEGPTVVVEAKNAVPPPRSQAPPLVKHLVFGVGEGQQPDPEYPERAIRERQQGTVSIQFTVGENGRVLAAEVTKPSRWPLLNQAALRKIRDSWSYGPGPLRTYDITYEFKLSE